MSATTVTAMTSPSSSSPLDSQTSPQAISSCLSPEVLLRNAEQQALVIEADALLMQERWTWVRELVESVTQERTCQEAKLFFLRFVNTNTLDAMDVVLSDLDAWRSGLEGEHKRGRRQLKEVSRTLFLLGADKQLDLLRTTASAIKEEQQP